MANKDHVKLLKRGTRAISKWRRSNNESLDLYRADLTEIDLRNANLSGANFEGAQLGDARFDGAALTDTNFSQSFLDGASFRGATLLETRFDCAHLLDVDFSDADFAGAYFGAATLGGIKFIGVNLSEAVDLDKAYYAGPNIIDINTLVHSGGSIPDRFLRGSGVPEQIIAGIPSMFGSVPMDFYSCFISYSHKDEEFCEQLYKSLRIEKLSVFYAPEHMKGGKKLHEQIYHAISRHDKLLLVLSESSMASEWVATEIYRARQREIKEGRQVLFPIRLASMDKIKAWEKFDADSGKDMAREIREYFIQDFSDWGSITSFELAFNKLIDDLRKPESQE